MHFQDCDKLVHISLEKVAILSQIFLASLIRTVYTGTGMAKMAIGILARGPHFRTVFKLAWPGSF